MDNNHLGKNIKAIRRLRGLTQQDLALKINKTRALVAHTEQTGKVSHYTLLAIAEALEVSESHLQAFDQNSISFKDDKVIYKRTETEILKEKLENCQNDNKMFRDLIESQKKLIGMLEEKLRIGE